MGIITTRLVVGPDGSIASEITLPPGEYVASVQAASDAEQPRKPFSMADFPVHHGPWDDSISLRREDMYGDDGR